MFQVLIIVYKVLLYMHGIKTVNLRMCIPSSLSSSSSKNSNGISPLGISMQLFGSQFFLSISKDTALGFRKYCEAVVLTSLLFLSFRRIELSSSCSIPYMSKTWSKSFSTRATPLTLFSSTEYEHCGFITWSICREEVQ